MTEEQPKERPLGNTWYAMRRPALTQAKRLETRTGRPHYVSRIFPDGYTVTDRMPLVGTWWSSDGVRHG
jgi:hypothetical protein